MKFKVGSYVQIEKQPHRKGNVIDVVEKPEGTIYLIKWYRGCEAVVRGKKVLQSWEPEDVLRNQTR